MPQFPAPGAVPWAGNGRGAWEAGVRPRSGPAAAAPAGHRRHRAMSRPRGHRPGAGGGPRQAGPPPRGDFRSDPTGNGQNPDVFKPWAQQRDQEGSELGGCTLCPDQGAATPAGPEAALSPRCGPGGAPPSPSPARAAPGAPDRARIEARDGPGARPTPAEGPGRGPGAGGASGNHPAAPPGRPLPQRGGPAVPRPHSPAAAAGALTEPPLAPPVPRAPRARQRRQ